MRQAPEQPEGSEPNSVGVLTCFYHAVEPSELRQSMESILHQDRMPAQWAVVADGPVDEALLDVVREIASRWAQVAPSQMLHFIELPENVGNAQARAVGMSYLTTQFVAVQDADDISAPDRLSRTVQFIQQEHLDFAGSYLAEFTDDPDNPHLVRTYPVTVEQLRRAVRLNNPVGHPSFVPRLVGQILAPQRERVLLGA
jgi:glycosyltransferase involved in cell wall biosynthesis